jgi:hypothetical protein
LSLALGLAEDWKQERGKDSDSRYHSQKLKERKGLTPV